MPNAGCPRSGFSDLGFTNPICCASTVPRTADASKASRRDDMKLAPGEPEAQRRGNLGLAATNDLGVQ